MIKVDLTKVKAYGDRLDDGAVQLSFTLPIKASEEAKEAAKMYVAKMGLKDPRVSHMEAMSEQFTFFVVYASAKHSINVKKIKVEKIKADHLDYKSLSKLMGEKLKKPLVVLGACTGADAHTVGIDAIFNMKGFDQDYGLERYPLIDAHNLRSQVDNEHFVKKAEEMKADAILVSQVVTQRDSHVKNLKELMKLIKKSKKLQPHLITIMGGPRIDHALAKKIGYDAGFGPGTVPSQVASFVFQEYLKRTGEGKKKPVSKSKPQSKPKPKNAPKRGVKRAQKKKSKS